LNPTVKFKGIEQIDQLTFVSELLNGYQEGRFSRTLLNHGILNSFHNFFKT